MSHPDRVRATVDTEGHIYLEIDPADPEVARCEAWMTTDQARRLAGQLLRAVDAARCDGTLAGLIRCALPPGHEGNHRTTTRAERRARRQS